MRIDLLDPKVNGIKESEHYFSISIYCKDLECFEEIFPWRVFLKKILKENLVEYWWISIRFNFPKFLRISVGKYINMIYLPYSDEITLFLASNDHL